MMRIVPLAAALAALVGGLAAPSAQATFPGRNGVIAGGWWSDSNVWDPTIGDVTGITVRAIRAFDEPDRILVGCEITSPLPAELRVCSERMLVEPAFSADGAQVTFSTWWEIGVADLAHDTVRYLPNPGDRVLLHSPVFSPDGQRIAFATGRGTLQLWIASVESASAKLLTSGSSPDWSVTGWIAFSRHGQIYRVRPDGSGLRRLTRRGGFAPSWAPGGRKLAFVRRSRYVTNAGRRRLVEDGGVFVLDVRTGRLVQEVSETRDLKTRSISEVRWSPDGASFALVAEALWRWERRSRTATALYDDISGSGADDSHALLGIAWQPLPR